MYSQFSYAPKGRRTPNKNCILNIESKNAKRWMNWRGAEKGDGDGISVPASSAFREARRPPQNETLGGSTMAPSLVVLDGRWEEEDDGV
jgi:hypothetical protein